MKDRDKKTIWNVIFAALGITATGLYFGLRSFLWRLWGVVSGIWVVLLLSVPMMWEGSYRRLEPIYWVVVFLPPVLLLIIAVLLNWIISGFRKDTMSNGKSNE